MVSCRCKLFDSIFYSINKLDENIEISLYYYPDVNNKDDTWYQLYAQKLAGGYKFYAKVYVQYTTNIGDMLNIITKACIRLIALKSLDSEDIKRITINYFSDWDLYLLLSENNMPNDILKKIEECIELNNLEEKVYYFYNEYWLINNDESMYYS